MIKFVGELEGKGRLFGFGLTEANLNRLEFNHEPIFFDFGYIERPDLFGLILCLTELQTPEAIVANLDAVERSCIPFFDSEDGVTPDTLRVFPIARSVMNKFREVPFWGFEAQVEIISPQDQQLFFAGRTEQEIEAYFQSTGFITPQTKKSYRGFGRQ